MLNNKEYFEKLEQLDYEGIEHIFNLTKDISVVLELLPSFGVNELVDEQTNIEFFFESNLDRIWFFRDQREYERFEQGLHLHELAQQGVSSEDLQLHCLQDDVPYTNL